MIDNSYFQSKLADFVLITTCSTCLHKRIDQVTNSTKEIGLNFTLGVLIRAMMLQGYIFWPKISGGAGGSVGVKILRAPSRFDIFGPQVCQAIFFTQ